MKSFGLEREKMAMIREVVTFGCRLNTYESEVIRRNLDHAPKDKDVIVFNTCAVTKEAERQARQSIRRARRKHPDAEIIVTGCSAQIHPEQYAKMSEVSAVLGNEEKMQATHFERLFSAQKEDLRVQVNDIMSITETASHMVSSLEGRSRAFVQVQNGCNHRCTFCIIPFGRGNSRSVAMGEVVNEVRSLVANGYKEVVLTGVDMTDYGKDLPGTPTLGQMVRRLLSLVPDLPRLRLSSIDVAEIDDELFELITREPRFMPHVHISLQAGDDMILKRMKRRHTRQNVVDFCRNVRKIRPEVAFGADIIAGFPTEDDAMFENTRALIAEAGIQHLHIFPYSERDGTPAAKMPQVPLAIRKQRAAALRAEGEKELQRFLRAKVGKVEHYIVENDGTARGEDFIHMRLEEKDVKAGTVIKAKAIGVDGQMLMGEVVA